MKRAIFGCAGFCLMGIGVVAFLFVYVYGYAWARLGREEEGFREVVVGNIDGPIDGVLVIALLFAPLAIFVAGVVIILLQFRFFRK